MSDDCVVAWISLRVSTRPYVARTVYVIRLYLARLYRSYLLRARACAKTAHALARYSGPGAWALWGAHSSL